MKVNLVGWTDPTLTLAFHSLFPNEPYEPFDQTITERVYFLLDTEASQVKIGRSANIQRRISDLSQKRRGPLELLGTLNGGLRLEHAMHARFRPYRREGNEWYSAEILPDVLAILTESSP